MVQMLNHPPQSIMTSPNTHTETFSTDTITQWEKTRKHIHAHPELRFEEHKTSQLIANRLRELGLAVTTGLAGTGVVGLLKAPVQPLANQQGHERPMLGLRADMDALPISEANTFEHASKYPGKMHACGHDGHVAMLLGAAEILSKNPPPQCDVAFIFQPAEEGGAGAKRMIEEGLFEQFPCTAVFAMHNWPGLAADEFAIHQGPVMASSNEFRVHIKGQGAHAAMPNLGHDPIIAAAHLITAYQTLISRNCPPVESAVLSVTQIHAGQAINAIPESAELAGTVRTFSTETLNLIERRLTELTQHMAQSLGVKAEVTFTRQYPPTVNHPEWATWATETLNQALHNTSGFRGIQHNMPPSMGAEDFAYMLQQKPGAYFWIGNGEGQHRHMGHGLGPCTLHNPSYDFNDRILPLGVRAWVALAHNFHPSGNNS